MVDDLFERKTRARIECDPCRVRLLGRGIDCVVEEFLDRVVRDVSE